VLDSKRISPLLDNYIIGDPISDHHGICCCPAMNKENDSKYIVKIISIPASQTQVEALLLTGAVENREAAAKYYEERANDLMHEIEILQQLSRQEGFLPCSGYQIVPKEDEIGFDVYILTEYKRSLERQFEKKQLTHLDALNIGLDICSALTACRRGGYIFTNLKPTNIYVSESGEYKISDFGFLKLNSLKYASIPERYIGAYSAPEITDAFSLLNDRIDVYSVGMILYRIYNGGILPEQHDTVLDAPAYADAELSQIILKACSLNPEDRWQDPAQMGQMLVSYMQKNGVLDTPIVPPAPAPVAEEPSEEESIPEIPDEIEAIEDPDADVPAIVGTPEIMNDSAEVETPDNAEEPIDGENSYITEEPDLSDCIEDAENSTDSISFVAAEAVQLSIDDLDFSDDTKCEESEEQLTVTEDVSAVEEEPEPETPDELDSSEDVTGEEQDALVPEPAPVLQEESADTQPEEASYYEGVSDEVNEILSKADSLAALQAPEPVVAPEAKEIVIPDPTQNSSSDAEESVETDSDISKTNEEQEDETLMEYYVDIPDDAPRKSHLVRNIILIVLLLGLLVGGFLFYRFYILQTVEDLRISGNKDQLTITVDSNIDETLLSVSCTEVYTMTNITVPVINGEANFSGLSSGSEYNIEVKISGLHILDGKTKVTYFTPSETKIEEYKVLTGTIPGSAILSFTVSGPNSQRWKFTYSSTGVAPKTAIFEGTALTLNDLVEGKVYTGILEPEDELFITESLEIIFTPSEIIKANDLVITACTDGKLTAQWKAPESVMVESWEVRCYNGINYDQTITTKTTTAEFTGLNSADGFTVEVRATGQSLMQTATVGANSITVSNITADTSRPGIIDLQWDASAVPANGWIITYDANGCESVTRVAGDMNKAELKPAVPGITYSISIRSADSVQTLCADFECTTPETDKFTLQVGNETITTENIMYSLCKRPANLSWTYQDIPNEDYTSKFKLSQEAAIVMFLNGEFDTVNQDIAVAYVVHDSEDQIISIDSEFLNWNSMWIDKHCHLNVPTLPNAVGNYRVTIYFNGQLVAAIPFTIL